MTILFDCTINRVLSRIGVQSFKALGSSAIFQFDRNKCILDNHKPAIKKYLELGVNISDIAKIINDLLEKPITYNAFKYFIKHDEVLALLIAK